MGSIQKIRQCFYGDLYKRKEITGTEALALATNPDAVALAMKGITTRDTSAGLIG